MPAHIVVRFRGREWEIGQLLPLLEGGRRRAALEALRDMAAEALDDLVCAQHLEAPTLVLAGTNPDRLRGRLLGCCDTVVTEGTERLERAFPDARITGEIRPRSSRLTPR